MLANYSLLIIPITLVLCIVYGKLTFRLGVYSTKVTASSMEYLAERVRNFRLMKSVAAEKLEADKGSCTFRKMYLADFLNWLVVAGYQLEDWRKHFAYVSQKSPLIGGTVRENMTYGLDREVSDEELYAAAKQANCYDFVMKKPAGFEEDVGLDGSNFSGGQGQCISIARAMLRGGDYLLLDEATSNLDVVSEAMVTEAMDHLMENKTTIMIAHNYAATKNADYIIVMKDGTVEAAGTSEELLETNEYYQMFRKTL